MWLRAIKTIEEREEEPPEAEQSPLVWLGKRENAERELVAAAEAKAKRRSTVSRAKLQAVRPKNK